MNCFPKDEKVIWDKGMVRWRQALQGFLIGVFKKSGNISLRECELIELVLPVFRYLRKKDGSNYEGDIQKCVRGALFANKCF